ncbi:MAG TPA: hypothetical protein DCS82_10795 [Rhodospirillaceae bacterium]|nr:hypothetical protein [Rhodospirillaceae bacterium]HAA93898.1 hypothetical protein [Rhodospirillaceae bacterium]HAT36196.1 hypothetical protein [Rhodospirillaceae bacterium]|tara:strand:+ start:73 stop:576 length:504 start_codon:yes stop_codon:yes gene_type:complete
MGSDLLRYDQLVENALKGVVREALEQIAEFGLPGAHHIYLTFATTHPGVEIPDSLMAKYPSEMTIVLQYQFWDLDVKEDGFAVSLSFNDIQERLNVPFSAVTGFADPSVNFALQFQLLQDGEASQTPVEIGAPLLADDSGEHEPEANQEKAKDGTDNVVALDAFRKD